MFATFYDVSKAKPKKQKEDPFAAFDKASDENVVAKEDLSSSKGFNITSNDLKQGTTLDKVLGGGFKKIDIFNSGFKGSDPNDPFPSGVIDEETDHASERGGYGYEDFEILETENEEEAFGESTGGLGRKQSRKHIRTEREITEDNENHQEIREKINKKYKHKVLVLKHKFNKVYRSPEPFSNYSSDFSKDIEEPQKSERRYRNMESPTENLGSSQFQNNLKEINYNQTHSVILRGTDSRSLSPSEGRVRIDIEKRIEKIQGSYYDGYRSNKANASNQMNGSRQNFHKNENNNPFRNSKTRFKKTMHNERQRENSVEDYTNRSTNPGNVNEKIYYKEENASKMRTTGMKQSFVNAYGADVEREKRQKAAMMGSESNRMRDTGTRFHPGKIGLQGFSQKQVLENNRIAERIRQHEQEMLDKYSNKRQLNQDESKIFSRYIVC